MNNELESSFRKQLQNHRNDSCDEFVIWVKNWFENNGQSVDSLTRFQLCNEIQLENFQNIKNEYQNIDFKLYLFGQVLAVKQEILRGWPPPIEYRVTALYAGLESTALDYVLLFEVLIHFHQNILLSEFINLFSKHKNLGINQENINFKYAWKIINNTIHDKTALGGKVWLERAAGLSKILFDYREYLTFPEIIDFLEPSDLKLHHSFCDEYGKRDIISKGGNVYNLLHKLQEFRNKFHGHPENKASLDSKILNGVRELTKLAYHLFTYYRDTSIATVEYRTSEGVTSLQVRSMWAEGSFVISGNSASNDTFFKPCWGNVIETVYAPTPPFFEDWDNSIWDNSLLLFKKKNAKSKSLYLMPWGTKFNENDSNLTKTALLYIVNWISKNLNPQPNIWSRYYYEPKELDPAEFEETKVEKINYIRFKSENAVIKISELAKIYLPDSSHYESAIEKSADKINFDLNHGNEAINLANNTVVRKLEINRLLTTIDNLDRDLNCGLVVLVGQSGSGKSTLMAQVFKEVSDHAIFFTVDNIPAPDYESFNIESYTFDRSAQLIELDGTLSNPLSSSPDLTKKFDEVNQESKNTDKDEANRNTSTQHLSDKDFVKSVAVPIRMHWISNLSLITKEPYPTEILSSLESARLFRAYAEKHLQKKIYVFIDAINQHSNLYDLFSGLPSFIELPKNVTVIVSTQDNNMIFEHLDNLKPASKKYVCIDISKITIEEAEELKKSVQGNESNLPELPKEYFEKIIEKSSGLPIFIIHWIERYKVLFHKDSLTALFRFENELDDASIGDIPKDYLQRLNAVLKNAVKDEYQPALLPVSLVWCLSEINRPINIEELFVAISKIQKIDQFKNLHDVSKSDIELSLAIISGFTLKELSESNIPRWRLSHPSLGIAWKSLHGKPSQLNQLNEALVCLGAIPAIKNWSISQCEHWFKLIVEDSWEFRELDLEIKESLLRKLIERISNDKEKQLGHLKSRLEILNFDYSIILWEQLKQKEAEGLNKQVFNQITNKRKNLSASGLDVEVDYARITRGLSFWHWRNKNTLAASILYRESLNLMQLSKLIFPKNWNSNHEASLINLYLDSFHYLNNETETVLQFLNYAISQRGDLNTEVVNYQTAYGYSYRASILIDKKQLNEAIEDLTSAISLFISLKSKRIKVNLEIIRNYLQREYVYRLLNKENHAFDDIKAALAIAYTLDQKQQSVKEIIASCYFSFAIIKENLNNYQEASQFYEIAIKQYATIDSDRAREEFAALQYYYAECLSKCENHNLAFKNYYAAWDKLYALPNESSRKSLYHSASSKLIELARENKHYDLIAKIACQNDNEIGLLNKNEVAAIFCNINIQEHEKFNLISDENNDFKIEEPLPKEYMNWFFDECHFYTPTFDWLKDLIEVRIKPVSFYHGAHLVTIIDTRKTGRREIFAIGKLGEELRILDWTNEKIYKANSDWSIDLSTDQKIIDYILFFFKFVRGRHGRFLIINQIEAFPWAEKSNNANSVLKELLIKTEIIKNDNSEATLKVGMLFNDSYFSANVTVTKQSSDSNAKGLVTLTDETLLIENLKVTPDAPPWIMKQKEKVINTTENPNPSWKIQNNHLNLEHLLKRFQSGFKRAEKRNAITGIISIMKKKIGFKTESSDEYTLNQTETQELLVSWFSGHIYLNLPTVKVIWSQHIFNGLILDVFESGNAISQRLIWMPKETIWLNGTSAPLHYLRNEDFFKINNAISAYAYLKLFCNYLNAEHGVFNVIEFPEEIHWKSDTTDDVRKLPAKHIQEVDMKLQPNGSYQIDTSTLYGNAFFISSYEVSKSDVKMLGDEPILADLPVQNIVYEHGWRKLR